MALDDGLRRAAALVYVEDISQELFELDSADSHHLAASLRLQPQEVVAASDGNGHWRLCRMAQLNAPRPRREPRAVVLEPTTDVQVEERSYEVCVAFSKLKGDRFEWAVAKMTEVGVDRITPLICERTVVREKSAARSERLARVAREAAMQSRRVFRPVVEASASFADFVAGLSATGLEATTALADPSGEQTGSRLQAVIVGPEGGFSPGERLQVERKVKLGDTVLRTETAAVTAGFLLCGLRSGLLSWPFAAGGGGHHHAQ